VAVKLALQAGATLGGDTERPYADPFYWASFILVGA
jgi:CHAT domain-containing protein